MKKSNKKKVLKSKMPLKQKKSKQVELNLHDFKSIIVTVEPRTIYVKIKS